MPGTEQLTVRAIAISWWGLTRLIRSLLSWIVSDDNASARVSHIAESWQHSKQGGGCCHATGGSAAISCPFFWLRQQICSFQGATFTSMGLHSPLQKRWIWIKGEAWVIEGDAHTLPSCCRSKWVRLPNETLLLHPFGTYLSYVSISIYPYLSISIHIYLSLYLSIYPSIYLSTYLPTYGTSLRTLNADLWFGLSCWGAFFGSCLSSAQKAWRQTIAALGVSRLLDRIEAFVPPLWPQVCHWCIVIPVIAFLYIYILLLLLSLLSLLISNFYLLNGYIYIYV